MDDRQELARECRIIAGTIEAFVAVRPDARRVDELPQAGTDLLVAEPTAFPDDLSVLVGERLQHLLIRLESMGFGSDRLDPLTYDGIQRLGARHAAETLEDIAREFVR